MNKLTLCTIAASVFLSACASKPAPKDFSPSAYPEIVRAENIAIPLPVYSPVAKYPKWQAAKRQDGWVLVEYRILANGLTDKVHVVDASPKKIFNQSAIEAVSEYRYEPIIKDGRAISVEPVRTKITFDAP